jgi:hypothetical protein
MEGRRDLMPAPGLGERERRFVDLENEAQRGCQSVAKKESVPQQSEIASLAQELSPQNKGKSESRPLHHELLRPEKGRNAVLLCLHPQTH